MVIVSGYKDWEQPTRDGVALWQSSYWDSEHEEGPEELVLNIRKLLDEMLFNTHMEMDRGSAEGSEHPETLETLLHTCRLIHTMKLGIKHYLLHQHGVEPKYRFGEE
tara:strand:- start:96 stop:416 length:321 start_codon:yes stop_codon:yes gene_type:complete